MCVCVCVCVFITNMCVSLNCYASYLQMHTLT